MRFIFAFVVLIGSLLAEHHGSNYVGEYYLYRDAIKFLESCSVKHLTICLKVFSVNYSLIKKLLYFDSK